MAIFRFFFLIIVSFMEINDGFAMDVFVCNSKPQVIAINNGLLTIVPGIVAKTECGWVLSGRKITSKRFVQDSLANLLVHQKNLDLSVMGAAPYDVFSPIVFKVNGRMIEKLGQFNKKEHRELKEALRQNKALYYTYGRGAFVYSMDAQPEENICQSLDRDLDVAETEDVKLAA